MPYKCLVRDGRHNHLVLVAGKSRNEVVTITINLHPEYLKRTLLSFSFSIQLLHPQRWSSLCSSQFMFSSEVINTVLAVCHFRMHDT